MVPRWSPDDPWMVNKSQKTTKVGKTPRMVPGWSLDGQTKSKQKGRNKVPRWSPDDPQMVPFREPNMKKLIKSYTGQDKFMGHARKAASSRSLCGSAAATYRTSFCFFSDLCVWQIFDFLDFASSFLWKTLQRTWLVWRFWDQLQPIGQVFVREDLFLAYFQLFGFQKLFYMEKLQ